MRKAGIELSLAWMEQYPSINATALGAFVKLSMYAIKYTANATLANNDEELEHICGVSGVNLHLAKSLFVESDGILHIPDNINYKTFGKETTKAKHVRKDIDTSLYSAEQIASFNRFIGFIRDEAPRVSQMQKPFTIEEYLRLIAEGFTADSVKKVLITMHNWKPLLQKNVSAYLTASKWLNNPLNNFTKITSGGTNASTKTGQQVDIHNKVKEAINNGTN